MYRLNCTVQKAFVTVAAFDHSPNCVHLWHRRLGHRDFQAIEKITRENLGIGLNFNKCQVNSECEVCCEGKIARGPFPKKSESVSKAVGDLIHTDLFGSMEVATPRGNRYLTMVDDYSRYCLVYLLRHKSEATDRIIDYTRMINNEFGRLPKVIR